MNAFRFIFLSIGITLCHGQEPTKNDLLVESMARELIDQGVTLDPIYKVDYFRNCPPERAVTFFYHTLYKETSEKEEAYRAAALIAATNPKLQEYIVDRVRNTPVLAENGLERSRLFFVLEKLRSKWALELAGSELVSARQLTTKSNLELDLVLKEIRNAATNEVKAAWVIASYDLEGYPGGVNTGKEDIDRSRVSLVKDECRQWWLTHGERVLADWGGSISNGREITLKKPDLQGGGNQKLSDVNWLPLFIFVLFASSLTVIISILVGRRKRNGKLNNSGNKRQ